MNKKILGAAALSTLAITVLGGCASITDQIAKNVAQSVVNKATNGQVTVNDQNGNITFKDNKGNVAQIGGGDQRPASAPTDMPSLPGANAFGWYGSTEGGMLTFVVPNSDYKTTCDQMTQAVTGAGWSVDDKGFSMEVSGSKTTLYKKPGFVLTLTCASSDSSKDISVTMSKGTDSSTANTSASSGSSQDTSSTGN